MNTRDQLIELQHFYSAKEICEYTGISQQTITKYLNNKTKKLNTLTTIKLGEMFNEHADIHAKEVPIKEFIDNINIITTQYAISTPDGYQLIAALVKKSEQACLSLRAKNKSVVKCAAEHLIQLSNGEWRSANSVKINDEILTETGISKITSIKDLDRQKVYDLTVDHPNHRYWSGGFSNHNTGKSYIAIKTCAAAQKKGLIPVIFDSESAIDKQTALNLGLDPSRVKYVPCDTIEKTRNAIYNFLTKAKEGGIENKFFVVIDSLGNLESEMSVKRMTDDNTSMDMGTRARAIKTLLRSCSNLAAYTKTTFLITNHTYDDPSAMYESIIKEQPGGKSVKYLPSVTVQLARKPEKADEGKTNDGSLTVGQRNYPGVILRALTVKNRFIQQYLQAEMYLSFQSGLDKYYGLLDIAVGFGVIIQNGSTYQLKNGTKLGYYKNWRKDDSIWDQVLPDLEQAIKTKWAYSSAPVNSEVPDESEDMSESETET